MIYYKNLKTNDIITLENENSIGSFFYNETLFKKLNEEEIKEYLFEKKQDELRRYVENEKDSKKLNYIVQQNSQSMSIEYSLDKVIKILENIYKENFFPAKLFYNRNFTKSIIFNNINELTFILNAFRLARANNYKNNIIDNMNKINNCHTIEELENLQFKFFDLIIQL
jgi:hypothetical protein